MPPLPSRSKRATSSWAPGAERRAAPARGGGCRARCSRSAASPSVHEERVADVVAAAGVEHALDAAVGHVDLGGDRPVAAAERRRRRRRDVRHRREVDVVPPRRAAMPGRGEPPNSSMVRSSSGSTPCWPGLGPPRVDQLPQLLGVLGGEVVALGEVLVEVVQAPLVVVERLALARGRSWPSSRRPRGRGGPSARSTGSAGRGGVGGVGEAWQRATRRASASASTPSCSAGGVDARGVEDGRRRRRRRGRTAVRMAPAVGDAAGPVHDERVAHAAAVGVLLVPAQRRVAGLGPAPRVVAVRVRAADVVEAVGDDLVDVLPHAVEEAELVHHAVRAALAGGAVVGEDHEQRVVEQPRLLEEVDEPADLVVGVLEHRRERLLQPGGEGAAGCR